VTFAAALLVILFLLALVFWQGRSFVPLSLAILGTLAAALMIQPFLFGAVLILIASGLLGIMVQGERAGPTLGAVRLLSMGALAMPLLLVAGWMTADGQGGDMSGAAWVLLAAAVILLGGFPFHLWVAPVVTEARALVPVVLFGLAQFMVVVFLLQIFQEAAAIQRNESFLRLLQISGAATAVLGGGLALIAPSLGSLLGYVLLVDIGATLLSLGLGGLETGALTLLLAGSRLAGLVTAGLGIALIRRHVDAGRPAGEQFSENRGRARQTPLGAALYLLGGLALAGAPLTAGFAGRYATVALAAEQSAGLAAALVLGTAAACLALLGKVGMLIEAVEPAAEGAAAETRPVRLAAAAGLGLALLLGLFPGWLPGLFGALAGLF
jgi:NADH:ubiquinone oxidoreductase subunit 2 (subunit N)